MKQNKCKRGHRLTRVTTYLRKNGTRECRRCSALRVRKFRRVAKRAGVEARKP